MLTQRSILHDLFTIEINGKMSGGLNTFASNCTYLTDVSDFFAAYSFQNLYIIRINIKIHFVNELTIWNVCKGNMHIRPFHIAKQGDIEFMISL